MSSNVYEDPLLMMNTRHSRGVQRDGGERVDRVVDIYESGDTCSDRLTKERGKGAHTPKKRNPFKAVALLLSLLCLLLLAALTVLYKLYLLSTPYKSSYEDLQDRYQHLSNSICRPQGNSTVVWKRFRCSCYYKSTESKNWNDSRADCQSRGADLVSINTKEEQDFLSVMNEGGASWVGLQSVENKKNWKWEWEWLDKSAPPLLSWKLGVKMLHVKSATAYMVQNGILEHTTNGLKGWICEKQVDQGFSGNLTV